MILQQCGHSRSKILPEDVPHPVSTNVPADIAADRGTAAAATTARMRRSMVMRSTATDGRSVPKCLEKWPDQPPDAVRVRGMVAAVGTARPSCGKARNKRAFTPVRSSSGDYQLKSSRREG